MAKVSYRFNKEALNIISNWLLENKLVKYQTFKFLDSNNNVHLILKGSRPISFFKLNQLRSTIIDLSFVIRNGEIAVTRRKYYSRHFRRKYFIDHGLYEYDRNVILTKKDNLRIEINTICEKEDCQIYCFGNMAFIVTV